MIRSMTKTATAERDDQHGHDAVDDEDVLAQDRREQQAAEARVVEDRLDQDRARHDRAEGQREGGDLRQQRVAHPVADEDPARLEPLRLGEQ